MENDLLNDLDLLVARIRREMNDTQPIVTEAGDPKDPRDIGTKIEIVLSTFNSNEPIDAKVDTGAEMSSIRVNNLKVNEQQGVCSFDFYKKNVTMGYDGFQAVKVGDKTENRPVVSFNVVVPTSDPNSQDMDVKNVKFNLNEVEGQQIIKGDGYMDVLLGMNFINAGKFRVVGRATSDATTESVISETKQLDDDHRQILSNSVRDMANQLVHWARDYDDPKAALEFMMQDLARQIREK
jgi:hypothetical protein